MSSKVYVRSINRVGEVFETKHYGKGEIIGVSDNKKEGYHNTLLLFKFYNTGTVIEAFYKEICILNIKDPSVPSVANKRVGEVFHSNNYGSGEIVGISDSRDKSGNIRFKFKFYKTGSVIDISYRSLKSGQFKDYSQPTVLGVGYSYPGATKSPFYKTWSHMLERCYNTKFKAYPNYGGRGVTVTEDWLTFSKFEIDALELEGAKDFLENPKLYSLDKDIKGDGLTYSKENCIFSNAKKQSIHTSKENNLIAIDKYGNELMFLSMRQCEKSLGLQSSNILKVLNGKRKSHKGYTFKRLEESFLKPKRKIFV